MSIEGGMDVVVIPPRTGYAEERRFNTSIFRSSDGTEERERLLLAATDGPLRSVSVMMTGLSLSEACYLDNITKKAMDGTIRVPLWLSYSPITQAVSSTRVYCVTTHRDFRVGGEVLVCKSGLTAWEYRTITAVNAAYLDVSVAFTGSTFAAGDIAVPLITASPKDAQSQFRLDVPRSMNVVFEELTGQAKMTAVFTPDTYLTYPIFDFRPDGPADERIVNALNIMGDDWTAREAYSQELPERILSFNLLLLNQSDRRQIIDFFDGRDGQLSPFWTRSRKADMYLATAANNGASTLEVVTTGEVAGLSNLTRHIYSRGLETNHKITGAAAGSGVNEIEIDPALSGALPAGSRFENLYFTRFDQDSLKLEWTGSGVDTVNSSIRIRELQRETP